MEHKICADARLLQLREKEYNPHKTFKRFYLKHLRNKCSCEKAGKDCIRSKKYEEHSDTFYSEEWVQNNILFLYSLYPIYQSTTQSLRCKAGKTFENCLEQILTEKGLIKGQDFAREIFIDEEGYMYKHPQKSNGYTVDYIFPALQEEKIHKEKFQGYICSLKTTLRERHLQDQGYKNLILISLEKIERKDIRSIQVRKDGTELEDLIAEIVKCSGAEKEEGAKCELQGLEGVRALRERVARPQSSTLREVEGFERMNGFVLSKFQEKGGTLTVKDWQKLEKELRRIVKML